MVGLPNWIEDVSEWWCRLFGYANCYQPRTFDGILLWGSGCLLVVCVLLLITHFVMKLITP